MHDLNKMGITAFQDQGGTGMKASHIEAFRMAHDAGQMTVRSFYNYYEEPRSVADVGGRREPHRQDGADQAVPGR